MLKLVEFFSEMVEIILIGILCFVMVAFLFCLGGIFLLAVESVCYFAIKTIISESANNICKILVISGVIIYNFQLFFHLKEIFKKFS